MTYCRYTLFFPVLRSFTSTRACTFRDGDRDLARLVEDTWIGYFGLSGGLGPRVSLHRCSRDVPRFGAKTAILCFRFLATKAAQAEGLGMHGVFLTLGRKLGARSGTHFRDFRFDGIEQQNRLFC